MRAVVLVVVAVGLVGCVQSSSIQCPNGQVCPEATACDAVHGTCVLQEQLDRCSGHPDGDACMFAGEPNGVCVDEVCLHIGCGDGIATSPEDCDGADLAGKPSCLDHNFHQDGPVTCTSTCKYDLSACAGYCGDGVKDAQEDCDTTDLGGLDCTDFGFYTADQLACSGACTFEVSGCVGKCGDGVVTAPQEDCDGTGVVSDCMTRGFYFPGDVTCNAACGYNTMGCTGFCGDGAINGSETCDGAMQNGDTCATYGYDLGDLGCSTFCTPRFTGCDSLAWKQSSSVAIFHDAFPFSRTDAFASASQGKLFRFDGVAWSEMTSPVSASLFSIWGSSPSDVFAVGAGGAIVHFDGTTWTTQTSCTATNLLSVWGSGPSDVYASGGSVVCHYNGSGWSVVSPGGTTWRDTWASGPNDVYMAAFSGLYLFTGTWSNVGTAFAPGTQFYAVGGSGPTDVYASSAPYGGAGTQLWHYDGTWSPVVLPAPLSGPLDTIWAGSPDNVFVAGNNGEIFHWDGVDWAHMPSPTGLEIYKLRGASDGTALLVNSSQGRVFRFRTGWFTPTAALVAANNLRNVTVRDSTDAYAVGYAGRVFHFDSKNWSQMVSGTGVDLTDAWSAGGGDVYVAGLTGTIRRYTSSTWSGMTSGTTQTIASIWGSSQTDVYAAAGSAGLLHYDGNNTAGGTWTASAAPVSGNVIIVRGTGATDVYAVDSGVLHYDGTWTRILTGTSFQWFTVAGPNHAYGVHINGSTATLHYYNGSTWTTSALPWLSQDIGGIAADGADDLFIDIREQLTQDSLMYHWDGASWTPVYTRATERQNAIAIGGSKLISVGDNGSIVDLTRVWHGL